MDKADEKVIFEGNEEEKYTNFEWLRTEVEVMREAIEEIVAILDYNKLVRSETIEPKGVDDEEIFKRLENDDL